MARPKDNLPPESQPWKRQIEAELDALSVNSKQSAQLTDLSLVGVSGSLRKIGEQIAELARQQEELLEQQGQLQGVVSSLQDQINYTSSLISREVSIDTFNSGEMPADQVSRWTGSEMSLSLPVSTGRIRVTTQVNHISLGVPTGGVVLAGLSMAVDGLHNFAPGNRSCGVYSAVGAIGASATRIFTYSVTPGSTVTVRARCHIWGAASSGTVSANFTLPSLRVEVINPN